MIVTRVRGGCVRGGERLYTFLHVLPFIWHKKCELQEYIEYKRLYSQDGYRNNDK